MIQTKHNGRVNSRVGNAFRRKYIYLNKSRHKFLNRKLIYFRIFCHYGDFPVRKKYARLQSHSNIRQSKHLKDLRIQSLTRV